MELIFCFTFSHVSQDLLPHAYLRRHWLITFSTSCLLEFYKLISSYFVLLVLFVLRQPLVLTLVLMSIKLQGNVHFSKHYFAPQKSPNACKIRSYQEHVTFIVFLFCFAVCPVHQTCGNPKMQFNCVCIPTILVQGKVLVLKRGIGDWLLTEVPARDELEQHEWLKCYQMVNFKQFS